MDVPDDGEAARPLRADARRNRAAILLAADEVFAAAGPTASTEEIARRAGLAIGTVFRHFPTKESLVEAVFVNRLRQLAARANALADADDPVEAFFEFLVSWTDVSADKHAFVDALVKDGADLSTAGGAAYLQVRAELLHTVAALLARAQDAGGVRRDLGIAELSAILIGTARMAEHSRHQPGVYARARQTVLDGLRADRRSDPGTAGVPTPRNATPE